jgi:plastocyanin
VRHHRPRSLALAAAASLSLALLAVPAPDRARAATHAVTISDFSFAPATLTITAGDTVTWTNQDPVAHTATSTGGAFDSGTMEQGESFSLTFADPGTYDYLCTPHPTMTGRIIVVAAPAAPPGVPAATPAPGTGSIPDVAMPPPDPLSPSLHLAALTVLGVLLVVTAHRLARAARRGG